MNKLIIPIIIAVIFVAAAGAYFVFQISSFTDNKPIPKESVVYPQKFHIEGSKIVDESGKEIIFRGFDIVSTTYLLKMDQKGPGLVVWGEDFFREMSAWGSKITRIQIIPEEWEEDRANAIKLIDQTIEWSKKYNMYIYLEYNVAGFPPTLNYDKESKSATKQDFIGFWDEISKKYKNEKTVAFYEIMNEPTYSSNKSRLDNALLKKDWLLWKEFAEEIIDVIRKNDSDSVIIVGGLVWGYDNSFALEYPIERENIVYGTHPYPWRSEHKSWDEAFGNIKNKYPVFATEFTVAGLATNLRKWDSVRNELSKIVYSEDLYEEGKKVRGNKRKESEIALKMVERIKKDRAALNYLVSEREKYKREIKSYLENKKISWTAFTFYSIYPEFSIINEDYTLTEQGEWFRQWLQEKK